MKEIEEIEGIEQVKQIKKNTCDSSFPNECRYLKVRNTSMAMG